MDRHLRAPAAERSADLPRPVVLGGILLLSAILLWTDTVAPRFLGSVLTFALAAAWCRWLERHPNAQPAPPRRAPAGETTASR